MDIKAVLFDVGETLVYYSDYLNWKKLYSPALINMMKECNIEYSQEKDKLAQEVLLKYNTRENFREYEVSSNTIFSEIFHKLGVKTTKLQTAKNAFYGFFQKNAICYEDTEHVLQVLKANEIKIGILTDVAYGMDNEFVFHDLKHIMKYFDIALTSTDVGYRKPRTEGYALLQKKFDILPTQMVYVGNEEKDIRGANNAEMVSVLVNRDNEEKNYFQNYTIKTLTEILKIIGIESK